MQLATALRLARTAAGWLAVAAMVLLASPGVRVVRAETPAPAEVARGVPGSDGPMCSVADVERRAERRAGVAAQVAARLQAEMAGADDVVVLNGRGYNYPSVRSPWLDLQQVETEAALKR